MPATRSVLQCLHRLPNRGQVVQAISRITTAYLSDTEPWVVGYSGGKTRQPLSSWSFKAYFVYDMLGSQLRSSTATRASRFR